MTGNQVIIHVREQGTAQAQSALKGLAASVAGTALGFSVFQVARVAMDNLTSAVTGSVTAFLESERSGARLESIIKATGNTLVRTRADFEAFSTSMQHATGVSDEAITDMQGILLTFKEIGPDVFDRTAEAALDMSAVFGQDLQSSAVQLGKALQDPITGMTALRRIGISFSESQQEAVKQFAATNDILGAQKLILKEVEAQVGGTARAMGETASGKAQRFAMAIDDLRESLGGAVVNGMTPLINAAVKWAESADAIEFTNNLTTAMDVLARTTLAAIGQINDLLGAITRVNAEGKSSWFSELLQTVTGVNFVEGVRDLWNFGANNLPASIVGTDQARARGAGVQSQGMPSGGWGVINEEAAAAQAAFIQSQRALSAAAKSSWGGDSGSGKKDSLVSAWESLNATLHKELIDAWVKGGQGRMEAVQAEQAKLTANVTETAQRMSEALGIPLADAILPAFASIRDAEEEMAAARVKAATDSFDAIEKLMRAEEELAKKRAEDAFNLTKSLWASSGGAGTSTGGFQNLAALANMAAAGGVATGGVTNADGSVSYSTNVYGDVNNVYPSVTNGGTAVPSTADSFSE